MCRKAPEEDENRVIIDNVSGTVKPGQFLAIIGASGAGKTTLLNYLSGKDPSKNLHKEGHVLVNGSERDTIDYNKYVAYVQQDDVLFQTMTVKECVEFAARMKLPPSTDHEAKVEELLLNLKLEKAANTKIGGPMVKGVSGGERKRTSIAVELISDPNLIFLDEPTTGLDSYTAQNVVEVLNALTESGRTVICTIHSPNTEIFESFDQLMLMASGHIIYMNDASKAVDYFASIGQECPPRTNPADFFMNMMSIEALDDPDVEDEKELKKRRTEVERDYKKHIDYLYTQYENSELKCDADSIHPESKTLTKDSEQQEYSPTLYRQFTMLLIRSLKNIFRLPEASYVKVLTYVFTSLLILLVYGRLGDDEQSIQSRNGVIFLTLLIYIMNPFQGIVLVFPDEKPVFLREQSAKMYSPTMYYCSLVVSQIPILLICTTLSAVLVYFPIGLNLDEPSSFWIYFGYSTLLMFGATGMGLCAGILSNDKDTAVAMVSVVVLPLILVAGFFVNQDNILPVLYPFQYISLFKYGYQVLTQNEYDGLELSCAPSCDPLGEMDFEQSMAEGIIATA